MAKQEQSGSLENSDEKLQNVEPPQDGLDENSPTDNLATAVEEVVAEFDADIFLYSGEIGDEGFGKLVQELSSSSTDRENVLLILTTNGGTANAAYQIARLLQNSYRNFTLFAPSYCKSAGTLVALGAHALIMDSFSELGPLDVQLLQPNELAARKSGLLSRSAFEGLRDESFNLFQDTMLDIIRRSRGHIGFKIASELSSKITSALMAPIYAQMNPDIIGSDKRDLEVATHYGARLIYHSGNANMATVFHLINHYPSHDFIIDFDEADGLFEDVDLPSSGLYKLIGFLGSLAYDEADPVVVQALHALPTKVSKENENDKPTSGTTVAADKSAAADEAVDEGRRADREGDSAS